MKPKHLHIKNNELYLHDFSLRDLAKTYKTPLYVFDEDDIKERIDEYKESFKSKHFETKIVYASKAFLTPHLAKIVKEKNIMMDSVSLGDLYVMKNSNFELSDVVFHGNNKTNEELEYALKNKVGIIVVDNLDELNRIDILSKKLNCDVLTMFRVNPGIDAHTHKYIQTASFVSKFGESIYDEKMIDAIIKKYQTLKKVKLLGFHSHIGSQIKEVEPFLLNIEKMMTFSKQIIDKYKIDLPYLNLGGGFGIKYYNGDSEANIKVLLKQMIEKIETFAKKINYLPSKVFIEPGRSIIASAGVTLYECGIIKETYGGKNYLFIDGGMTDNIRPALYQAKYEVDVVNKVMEEKKVKVDVAGKCCESGDIIAYDVMIPKTNPGDVLVVYATGAYTHSMSSNYNNNLKPGIIFVSKKITECAKKEELKNLMNLFL